MQLIRNAGSQKHAFYYGGSVIISWRRTLLQTVGPYYATVLNQENAFSLGFATFLVAAVPPNTGHVPSAVI